jgi:hypothetical protein
MGYPQENGLEKRPFPSLPFIFNAKHIYCAVFMHYGDTIKKSSQRKGSKSISKICSKGKK